MLLVVSWCHELFERVLSQYLSLHDGFVNRIMDKLALFDVRDPSGVAQFHLEL